MSLAEAMDLVKTVCFGMGVFGAAVSVVLGFLSWNQPLRRKNTVQRAVRIIGFVQGEKARYPVADLGENGDYRPIPVPSVWRGEMHIGAFAEVRWRKDDLGSARLVMPEKLRKTALSVQILVSAAVADGCVFYLVKSLLAR